MGWVTCGERNQRGPGAASLLQTLSLPTGHQSPPPPGVSITDMLCAGYKSRAGRGDVCEGDNGGGVPLSGRVPLTPLVLKGYSVTG